jgi:hypothetical protein
MNDRGNLALISSAVELSPYSTVLLKILVSQAVKYLVSAPIPQRKQGSSKSGPTFA